MPTPPFPPLVVGDKVRMWKDYLTKLKPEIWTVVKTTKAVTQSGYMVNVEIPECSHCGAHKRKIVGYDSSWFVKVENDSEST